MQSCPFIYSFICMQDNYIKGCGWIWMKFYASTEFWKQTKTIDFEQPRPWERGYTTAEKGR